jgi:hypothetical protein
MGTNEDHRFQSSIKARVRLKLLESKLAIQSGQWIERDKGIAAAFNVKHDVGNAFAMPESMGKARPYFPQSEWDSEEYKRVNGAIDKEREDYWARCEAFERIGESVALPPLPTRPSLDAELAEVNAKLAEDLDNVTIKGLLCYVQEQAHKLKGRVEGTVPREYLEEIVWLVNLEVEKVTGRKQCASLPPIQNDPTWIRKMGARADV